MVIDERLVTRECLSGPPPPRTNFWIRPYRFMLFSTVIYYYLVWHGRIVFAHAT